MKFPEKKSAKFPADRKLPTVRLLRGSNTASLGQDGTLNLLKRRELVSNCHFSAFGRDIMRSRFAAVAAIMVAALPSFVFSEANVASILTPSGGPMAGTNGGYVRQLLPNPFWGGYFACGHFGGLQTVLASGIAYISPDGISVTSLAGPASVGAAGTISGVCTAVALDPMDSDSVYVGIAPSGTCGTITLSASAAGLCKWSWASQTWTLLATGTGMFRASIRAISIVTSAGSFSPPTTTVYFGGDFTSGCASPRGITIMSPSLCKIVGGVVTGMLNRDTGIAGVAPLSINGVTTVRAIVPAGPAAPSWLASTGADPASAAFVCGEFASAGGVAGLKYLFIAANDANNASNTLFQPLLRTSGLAPIDAVDNACWAAIPVPTRPGALSRALFAGQFATANGGATPARKLVAFDGKNMTVFAPSMPSDSTVFTAIALDATGSSVYAAMSSPQLNFVTYGFMARINVTSGAISRLVPPSGIPGAQVGTASASFALSCSPTRASLVDGPCKPLTFAPLLDGRMAVGGSFEVVDGTTVANGLAYWSETGPTPAGSTITPGFWSGFGLPGAGANDIVYAAAPLPLPLSLDPTNRTFVLGGSFTFVGGVAARAAAIVQPTSE